MSSDVVLQKPTLKIFETEFAELLSELRTLVRSVSDDQVYRTPTTSRGNTFGEAVVKSAATLEQAFGGLTANLWDDPFEWTLPETLTSAQLIIHYLQEVEVARRRAFGFLADDSALEKKVSVPWAGQISLLELLRQTLARAREYRNEAVKTLKTFTS